MKKFVVVAVVLFSASNAHASVFSRLFHRNTVAEEAVAPAEPSTAGDDPSVIDHALDFVQADFQAVQDMATSATPVDELGRDCGRTVVAAIVATRKSASSTVSPVGLASGVEKLRLIKRAIVYNGPLYMEAGDRCRAAGIDLRSSLGKVVELVPALRGLLN